MMNTLKRNENGFTLVELAIALMVIGLLIGGVLKGQELVENARITRTVKDISDFDTAIMIFRSSYGGFPGDLRNAGARLPNCDATPTGAACNNTTGVGNNQIDSVVKSSNFWRHLARAGMITSINDTGTAAANTSPKNSFGGFYAVYFNGAASGHPAGTGSFNNFKICDPRSGTTCAITGSTISVTRMAAIDAKMDDGLPLTGQIIVNTAAAATACYDTAATPLASAAYLTGTASLNCASLVRSNSMN